MQKSPITFNEISNRYIMKININKTEVMVLKKESIVTIVNIQLDIKKQTNQTQQYNNI